MNDWSAWLIALAVVFAMGMIAAGFAVFFLLVEHIARGVCGT